MWHHVIENSFKKNGIVIKCGFVWNHICYYDKKSCFQIINKQ